VDQDDTALWLQDLYETSEDEVLSLIENLAEGKTLQYSDIPTKLIKLSAIVLAPILTRICNRCINEGSSDCFKIAQIIIYKSSDQTNCRKY